MQSTKKILLISNSYPAKNSPEKVFILPELRHLANIDIQITLMPVRRFDSIDSELPINVYVSDELANAYSVNNIIINLLSLLINPVFWQEIWKRPSLLFRWRFWKESVRAAVAKYIFKSKLHDFDLFYTYWFCGETTGLAWAGVKPIVTRAHGYDIYTEVEGNNGWIPYRYEVIKVVGKIIVLSIQARDYLINRFTTDSSKILVYPLGVEPHIPTSFDESYIKSEIFFLSCSYPATVKRLPLIAEFMYSFAMFHPDLNVCWTHIGAEEEEIGITTNRDFLSNLTIKALGRQSNEFVISFFQKNEISFFINLSSSEGMPVSIMEAMSFGIPVIATSVGGIPDMLHYGGGILLEKDFDLVKVVKNIADVFRNQDTYYNLRQEAISVQRKFFDSTVNHKQFAEFISNLIV